MNISKELFDKMLRAAILKDRINYSAGLISEVDKFFNYEVLRRKICKELSEQLNSLGVEPLTYEALCSKVRENELGELFHDVPISMYASTHNGINWEQRRYEIARVMLPAIYSEDGIAERAERAINSDMNFEYKSLPTCALQAVQFADALIKELKTTKQ